MVMQSAPLVTQEIQLDQLQPKTCAIVRRINGEGEDIQRLQTLGICVGRRVEVVKAGDPMIVRVFSSRIGMSAELASSVWLETCESSQKCAIKD